MDDATFAPQSPDLSGYYNHDPEPVHPQHQQYRCSVTPITPFNPTGPQSPFAQAKFGEQRFFPPQHPFPQHRQPPTPTTAGVAAAAAPILKQPVLPKRESNGAGDAEWESMAPSTRKKLKTEVKEEDEYGADIGNGNVDVKTKFPVARIKRIMQSDEDVGKVAQVTPVVVSKALELFMIDLVTSAATEAKTRSSKRVTAAHLKQAVMTNEKYRDWLGETVSKVPDATAAAAGGGGGRAAKDEDSDDWEGAPAKKKRGAGRRKKKDDD